MRKKVTDAEFTVISDPRRDEPPPRKWWQGWTIDWTVALAAGALAALSAIRGLIEN